MAKKISQLTQATEVKSDDVTVIVQDGETKKLPLNMMVTKQDIENKKVVGLAKLDEIEATYENDTYTPTITVKNKSSVKVGEGDGVDYSANVMDGHAKSAILSGNTLVNLFNGHALFSMPNKVISYDEGVYTYQAKEGYEGAIVPSNLMTLKTPYKLELNKKYTFFITQLSGNPCQFGVQSMDVGNKNSTNQSILESQAHNSRIHKFTFTLTSDYSELRLRLNNYQATEKSIQFKDIMIIEGDYTNVDIPYFEGMQSAKMPVLKTVGKNLLNPSLLIETPNVVVDGGNATINIVRDKRELAWVTIYDNLNLPVGNYYILCEVIDGAYIGGNLGVWDNNNLKLEEFGISNGINLFSFNNCSISKLGLWQPAGNNNCKLRLSIYTNSNRSYEPYKSNILTVNEDVTLRGIGDVEDTLDCLTGEVTERIGEIIIDGLIQPEGIYDQKGDTFGFFYPVNTITPKNYNQDLLMQTVKCDKLRVENHEYQWMDGKFKDEEFISITADGRLAVRLFSSKASTISEFCEYFSQKPITVQYQLATESIKTVDLMPSGTHPSTTPYCWKNGHIQLSSSGLLPNLEYSVVTSRAGQINQNATMVVKNDKRIFDLEILLAGGLVNTTYQALTLQNQVETGLSKVSLNSEKEPDYLLYHMIMKLIEEKAYKLDDLAEKVSVFYLYEKLSDEQFETIYSELYPFVEEEYIELPEDGEIIEEPIVDEVLEEVENGVVM